MSNQLVKKNSAEGYQNVFPKTWIDAIKDKESGVSLQEILQGFNMYFLSYNGSRALTRCKVPTILRKEGLWITYVLYDHTVVTEWYNSDQIDDNSWSMDSNWRIASNALVGDISVSSDGYWVINGERTEAKAQGEQGVTPLLRVGANNKLQVSYNAGKAWKDISDYIVPKFRWNQGVGTTAGTIQISMDLGKTWTNLSNEITNNLRISRYIGINESLPTSGVAEGTIYMKGPYYNESDTSNTNPIYRMWVYAWKGNTLAWQDNGEFTSISTSVVQERGNSTTEVMSQDAVTKELTELESKNSQLGQKVDSFSEKSESVVNLQNGSNYTLLPVKAKTGDKIKIKLNTTSNSTLTRFEIYYNGVWSNKLVSFNGVETVSENINKWLEVTAPADITVIGWGVWNSSGIDETITLSFDNEESLENRVSKNTSDISEIQKEINSEEASQNLINTTTGSNYALLPIDVKVGEQIQVKFNTTRNDVLTRFIINYNDDFSKKIIDANGVDAVTENINKWIDFTAPIDMTYLGYAVWNSNSIDEIVTISFRNKNSVSYKISALQDNDQILKTEIENINFELGNAVQVSPDLVTGKFITDSGTISTNSGYAYTEPIELKKGDELIVNAAGYGTSVAIISLYSNETYTPVVISYGSGSIVRDYSYIAENDCNIVCSFSIQSGLGHIISVKRFAESPVSYDGIPYVSMFRTLLCIGDSTTAGVVDWRNPSVGADTVPEYSWPTVFNKITGVPIFNYGQASATCKSWYINHYPNGNMGIPEGIPGREPAEGTVKYDACVIQLGVNDWFKIVSDLGREPVNAEECASQIAEAKEYLGYLIEYTKVCSTSCKIFLATTSSAFNNRIASFFLSAWKTMLEELAVEYTDVFVVDINTYSKLENEVFFYNHPTALGYAKTAQDLASYISYIVAQNIAQFRNVQFIRTNHSY